MEKCLFNNIKFMMYRKESINPHPLQLSPPPLNTPNGNGIFFLFTFHPPPPGIFFWPFLARFWEGKKRREGREKEMKDTDDDSVEPGLGFRVT
jgi:hypothetical protein